MNKLTVLNQNTGCTLCPRHSLTFHRCKWGVGTGVQPTIMIVLDTPTKSMESGSDYFAGRFGTFLREILNLAGIKPTDVYITFAVKCCGYQKLGSYEMKKCRPYLQQEIEELKPQLIIGMGTNTAHSLMGKRTQLKKLRQRIHDVEGIKAGFTFSPLMALSEPHYLETIANDVRWIIEAINRGEDKEPVDYLVNEPISTLLIPDEGGEIVSFDLETDGLNPFDNTKEILTASLSAVPRTATGFRINHPDDFGNGDTDENIAEINRVLQSANTIVGQNIKFDMNWWATKYGVAPSGPVFDTKVAYTLLNENSPDNSLKYLAASYTDMGHYEDAIDVTRLREYPFDEVIKYNMRDVDATTRLYPILRDELEKRGQTKLMEFMMEVLPVLSQMERKGIAVDREWASKTESAIVADIAKSKQQIFALAGREFTLDSAAQLGDVMYNQFKLPVIAKTPKGQPATNKDTLVEFTLRDLPESQLNLVKSILVYRKNVKLYNTYYAPLDALLAYDGRLHTTYNLTKTADAVSAYGTVTGRLSSSNPNLQNIPGRKDVRGMFYAPDGRVWADGDYGQLELRVAAYYSNEPVMMDAFHSGRDIHTAVLADMLGRPYDELVALLKDSNHAEYEQIKKHRVAIKRLNFGILYGVGPQRLQTICRQLGVTMTTDECIALIKQWLAKYPKVAAWIGRTKKAAVKNSEVKSPTGRTRHLLGASFNTAVGKGLIRQAVNFPIQTFASEICLSALILIDDYFRRYHIPADLVLTVHDSIAFEITPSEQHPVDMVIATVRELMDKGVANYLKYQFGINFNVPLAVDFKTGQRWGE